MVDFSPQVNIDNSKLYLTFMPRSRSAPWRVKHHKIHITDVLFIHPDNGFIRQLKLNNGDKAQPRFWY